MKERTHARGHILTRIVLNSLLNQKSSRSQIECCSRAATQQTRGDDGRVRGIVAVFVVFSASCILYAHKSLNVTEAAQADTRQPIINNQNAFGKHQQTTCNETFNETLKENLEVIKNYPRGNADHYMWKLGGNMSKPVSMLDVPVIVTALTRHYYPKSQAFFKSVHEQLMSNPKYARKLKLVVYDIGLTRRQANVMQRLCKCEFRKFPFHILPKHMTARKYYAWKPIIVQILLMEFGFVFWLDASVRFTTDDIDTAISLAKQYSFIFRVHPGDADTYSVTRQTFSETFKYLGEDVCKFRHIGEVLATVLMIHFDEMSKHVVNAWAICALNENCIAPVKIPSFLNMICDVSDTRDHRCHRFDQSVVSILSRRIYHKMHMYSFSEVLKNMTEIRSDIIPYFENCQPPPEVACFL